jgi:Domain of unknown function (DUF5666)
MSASSLKPRSVRLAIYAVTGVVTLSIAACSTSHNQNSGQPSTPASPTSVVPKPPPAPPVGHDVVEGLVRSVSGNRIQLTQRDRTAAAVDFTPSTMVTELSSAALTDVKPGSCVDVKAASQSGPPGGGITAESVEISPSEGGKCPPPIGPAESPSVNGIVDSVTGNTIAVNGIDPTGKATHTTVTVITTTTYTKHAVTNAQAIQNGKCLAAQGTKDGGVLHAATIDLEPCPPMGRPHHHFHIPWPHHRH